MEILIRIAIVKYKESKECKTTVEAIGMIFLHVINLSLDKLITEHLYSLTPELLDTGFEFREK